MGVQVQVNAGYSRVWLYTGGVFDAGQTATLTNTEYSKLSSGTLAAITVTNPSVTDPVRSPVYSGDPEAELAAEATTRAAADTTETNRATAAEALRLRVDSSQGFNLTQITQGLANLGVNISGIVDGQAIRWNASSSTFTPLYAPSRPNLSSLPIFAYGNSYTVMPFGSYTTGNHYLQNTQTILNCGTLTSYGIGGTRIVDVLSDMINQAAIPGCVTPVAGGKWPGSSRYGLVVFDTLFNDIGHYASQLSAFPAAITTANTQYRDGYKGMLRAALALASSASRIEDTSATHTGAGWTAGSPLAYASGGTISFTTTVGNKSSYTVTPPQSGPLAGKVFFLTYKLDTSVGVMAQQTIDVDGANSFNYTPAPWEKYVGSTNNVTLVPDCVTITVPVDGNSHTVNITHSGSAGQYMYDDGMIIPSVLPSPIAYMSNECMPVAGPLWTQAQVNIFQANAAIMIPAAKLVVAEFPNAMYVTSTMTSNGIYSGDGVHPNDRGHKQRANDLVDQAQISLKAWADNYVLFAQPNSNFTKI